jgi:chromosome segregation ATPase
LGQANSDYGFSLEELQQLLFLAKGNPNFDPAVFLDLLVRESQAMNRKGKDDRTRHGDSGSGNQPAYPAIEFRATAANDVDLLNRFNATLVENLELKAQAERKEKKITELSRDLLQYKKKVKTIAEIDERVASLVSQNSNLKAALLELQSKAVEKTNEGSVRLSELNANVETSTKQLDLLLEANHRNQQVKRNLEKKASVLQAQLDTIRMGYEKRIAELEREVQGLKNIVEEKNANIAYLELENKKIEVQAKRIRQLELDFEGASRESEFKERTITLLKSNLQGLTQSTDKDSEKLSLEAVRLRDELTKEMHEKAENYVGKLAVEASLADARSLLSEQQAQLKSWAEREREWSTRTDSLTEELRELKMREGVAVTTARQFKMEIEALEDQKRRYHAEYKQLRDKMEDVLERNNEIMVEERRRLATEIAKQFEEALLQREGETEALRRSMAEMTYKLEGKDQEITDLKARNDTRTRQLLNFNKYISAVTGGKAAEKSETTFLVNQNKTLLGEVEGLRAAVARLETRNRDILAKLEPKDTATSDEETAIKGRLAAVKKKAFMLQKGSDGAENLVLTELVRAFEEVIVSKDTAIAGLQNIVILNENAAKEEKDRQLALERKLEDKESDLKSLEDRLAKFQTELARQKSIGQATDQSSHRMVDQPGRPTNPENPTVDESDGHFENPRFDD